MTSIPYKQDLPPAGGYEKITYERVPMKTMFYGRRLLALWASVGIPCYFIYNYYNSVEERLEAEIQSGHNAIKPIFMAERDRAELIQVFKNREEERELMKNVKGWKVGHWYNEPMVKSLPPGTWIEPSMNEFYMHTSVKTRDERHNFRDWF